MVDQGDCAVSYNIAKLLQGGIAKNYSQNMFRKKEDVQMCFLVNFKLSWNHLFTQVKLHTSASFSTFLCNNQDA